MSYVYTLLKRVIESNNPYIGKDRLDLLLMNFLTTGDITQEQYDELDAILNSVEDPTV